jgi:hypothetical protein
MFKAAFPWASTLEEEAERRHHKELSSAVGSEEVAGSVWVAPDEGMSLSAATRTYARNVAFTC